MPPSATNAPRNAEEMLRGAAAAAYGGRYLFWEPTLSVTDICLQVAQTRWAISLTFLVYIISRADQTHAAAHVFFLAMALHKDVQEKAQSELDSVVGPDRLPTFVDRESLPYITALVKEVLRWHVIAPIGVAHRSVADDVYDGYLIPAGTLIVPNQW